MTIIIIFYIDIYEINEERKRVGVSSVNKITKERTLNHIGSYVQLNTFVM